MSGAVLCTAPVPKVCFAAMSAVGLARQEGRWGSTSVLQELQHARVFTWRLAETNFYLAMSMLA